MSSSGQNGLEIRAMVKGTLRAGGLHVAGTSIQSALLWPEGPLVLRAHLLDAFGKEHRAVLRLLRQ